MKSLEENSGVQEKGDMWQDCWISLCFLDGAGMNLFFLLSELIGGNGIVKVM